MMITSFEVGGGPDKDVLVKKKGGITTCRREGDNQADHGRIWSEGDNQVEHGRIWSDESLVLVTEVKFGVVIIAVAPLSDIWTRALSVNIMNTSTNL